VYEKERNDENMGMIEHMVKFFEKGYLLPTGGWSTHNQSWKWEVV
jgi:hypothetical protein